MFKNKNKYDRLKVPMLQSMGARPSVKPKLQNNIEIKPSSGYRRQVDYRFQTDQQIQTEQSCRQIINKEIEQQRKNSFSRMISELKQANFDRPNKDKIRKQLQIFNCDSLAIRPSGNASVAISKYSTAQPYQSKYIPVQPTDAQSNKNGQQESIMDIKIRRLNGSRKVKPRKTIFDPKYMKQYWTNQNLPTALIPYEIETFASRKQNKKRGQEQFHIVFETDEITQCCF